MLPAHDTRHGVSIKAGSWREGSQEDRRMSEWRWQGPEADHRAPPLEATAFFLTLAIDADVVDADGEEAHEPEHDDRRKRLANFPRAERLRRIGGDERGGQPDGEAHTTGGAEGAPPPLKRSTQHTYLEEEEDRQDGTRNAHDQILGDGCPSRP